MGQDAALIKVREQIEKVSALETPILKDELERAHRDQQEISFRFAHWQHQEALKIELLTLRSEGNSTPLPISATTTPRSQSRNQSRQRRNLNPSPPLFLHPLDIRILPAHFHNYPSFPDTITVRVESVSEGTVNDDLRKRPNYLAHMPEGADLVFIETDLEGVVGADLKNFEAALKMRMATSQWANSTRLEHQPKEGFSALEDVPLPSLLDVLASPSTTPALAPVASGTWGFASALHSSPSRFRAWALYGQTEVSDRDLPHRISLTNKIFEQYLEDSFRKTKILTRVSLTSDIWSDPNLAPFFTMTCHYPWKSRGCSSSP